MRKRLQRAAHVLAAGATLTAAASAQILISDDFETDTSADYFLIDDGSLDGTRTFNFDYTAIGIPPAPRSTPGETRGLKLTANDTLGQPDAYTLFHNDFIIEDRYTLTVDVWMNFVGVVATTEHAHVGVGSAGTTWNQLFSPISGDGAYIAFTGDGGVISDYRWFRAVPNTPPGDPNNTTLPNSHPSYLGNGSNNTGSFFQNLFPSPPSTVAGSPGNIWTTVKIEVDNIAGLISFYFDDVLTFQGEFANRFDGHCSLGIADTFASISTADNFCLFDNFTVEGASVSGSIGTNYCNANPNSTGLAGAISAVGSTVLAQNNVTLQAANLPPGQFGIFVTSRTSGFTPNVGSGNLCVDGNIGRYQAPSQIRQVNANGEFALQIDVNLMPQGATLVPIAAGETWYFQAWHRDFTTTPPITNTSNLTNGLEIGF